MKNFRTYQLALALHRKCEELSVRGELKDQLGRATLSIVLNLAEGSGKLTMKDRRKFFSSAFGSLREVQACLELVSSVELTALADETGAHVYKLLKNPGYLLN